jgi:hypothetical protein
MKLPTIKNTKLEVITKEEITPLLNSKIAEYTEKNLPIEQSLADYIALGIQNIDFRIEQLKNYKKMLDEEIKELSTQKQNISEEVADYVETNLGVEKLKGAIVSSITIKQPGERKTKKFILDVDKDELIKSKMAHYEEIVTPTPKQIKVNKRRS